jgi:magnesium chelatase subunit I
MEDVVTRFKAGASAEVGDTMSSENYIKLVKTIDGLQRAVAKLDPGENIAVIASATEFVFEGLHLNKRLNKDRVGGKTQYRG